MLDSFRYGLSHGFSGWRALRATQRWASYERAPRRELDRVRSAKLQHLLQAAQRTPYWNELLRDHNQLVASNSAPLAQLPILTKQTVRTQGSRMLVNGAPPRGVTWSSTGGSTGEPLRIARDAATSVAGAAARLRGFRWLGVRPGARLMAVKNYSRISWRGWLYCLVANIRVIDPIGQDQGQGSEIIRRLRAFQPLCLDGYPTSLLKLAELAEGGTPVEVPVIFATGEMLYPAQRQKLAATFSARVAVYYGCNEVSSLAYECEHGRLHVSEEHVILETVDANGQPVWEQPGRLLVTDLDNHVMPFLRYEVGDRGTLTREPCPCGRTLTVLQELQGRLQDVLQNARGDILPAIFFAGQFRQLPGVRAYQLVQTSLDKVTIRYVVAGADAKTSIDSLCGAITARLGPQVQLQRERCETIPLTPRGKMRLVMGLTPP